MLMRLTLIASLLQFVSSFKGFQSRLPNGDSVPVPCKPGTIWQGVGHFLVDGTGARNHFGLDFVGAGLKWTEALCRLDSDGDGRSNGAELGDPDCVWKEQEIPRFNTSLSHPGICDPWDSPACQQRQQPGQLYASQGQWMAEVCRTGGLDCPALEEDGVKNLTIRFPTGSSVPTKETTYICMTLDIFELGLPKEQDFHLVAVTPAIDNKDVLHHISLSACTDGTSPRTKPYECGALVASTCEEYLYVWTAGRDGECFNQQAGIRIGRNGYRTITLELHWNNPERKAGLTDSSGLVLHYTPNLRPYDAGILMVGPSLFFLPPHQESLEIRGQCASQCTQRQMLGPVFITSAWNHMHYAGSQMSVEVTRNKKHVTYLTDDKTFDFHTVRVYNLLPPLVFVPGDELHTRCVYNTSSRNRTTLCNMGAQDEMCFSFISYYPKENLTIPVCLDMLGVSTCNPESWGGCSNLETFTGHINQTQVFQEVTRNCQSFFPCLTECLETILKFMRTEPCMAGQTWDYIQSMITNLPDGMDFLSRLASCKVEVYTSLTQSSTALTPSSTATVSTSAACSGRGDIYLAMVGYIFLLHMIFMCL